MRRFRLPTISEGSSPDFSIRKRVGRLTRRRLQASWTVAVCRVEGF
jgi:hypothetical protein